MRTIRLDQLTKDFFAYDFGGIGHTVDVECEPWAIDCPVVEIPAGIPTEWLMYLAKQIPLEEQSRPYKQEDTPRFYNWAMTSLWCDTPRTGVISDVYYQKHKDPEPHQPSQGPAREIQTLLKSHGIDIDQCWLSRFGSDGYLRPHRDIGMSQTPLDYFWIPLNGHSELKIYPYGQVDINLGSLYLLNNENYVHAVRNMGQEDRYVLVGWLNHSSAIGNEIIGHVDRQYHTNRRQSSNSGT